MFNQRRTLLALALSFAASGVALAQDKFPNKPVTVIVPQAAGGANDAIARVIAQKLSEQMGQPFVIDNRTGAGGNVGTTAVARAKADGYTLMVTADSAMVINPSLYQSTGFDPIKDFDPVGTVATAGYVLVANPSFPAKNTTELIALAKQQPGKINIGSAGNGTLNHLIGEMLSKAAGIDMVHVPYKAQGPALNDLLGGNIDLMFGNLPDFLPYIKSGKIKAIGTTYLTRAPLAPEIPTIAEQGFPTFETDSWYGIVAPSSMTKDAVDRMNQAINKALQDPAVKKNFGDRGIEIIGGTPAKFQEHIQSEIQKYERIVKSANMQPD